MADPWSVVSEAPAAQKTPWSVVSQKPAPQSPYESETAFRSRMDKIYGPGKWEETSGYRDPAHNRAVGGVPDSSHMRGSPDAPGAHDIVVPGMPEQTAASKLPKTYRVLAEGRVGREGPHLHVEDADPWAVQSTAPAPKEDPWKVVGQAPAASPPPPPAQPSVPEMVARRAAQIPGEVVKGVKDWYGDPSGVSDPLRATGHRFMENLRGGLKHEFSVPRTPQEFAQRALEIANPAMSPTAGAAAGMVLSPVGGAVEAASKAAGSKHAKAFGDIAEAVVPIPGLKGAEAARDALRFGEEVGTEGAERVIGAKPTSYRPDLPRGEAATRRQLGVTAQPPHLTPIVEGGQKPGGRRSIAAIVEKPPRTDVVGSEANPATRTANALYRSSGRNLADKIEVQQFRRDLPPEIKDPKVKEDLYHALESRLVDPKAKIPKALQPAYKAIQPYLKEQTAIINRLRARNDPDLEPFLNDQGYVHRIREDQPSELDPTEGGPRSPFYGRKSLVKTAAAQKARKFVALEDKETGKRTVVDTTSDKAYAELKPGMEYRPPGEGPAGAAPKAFKVTQPTTREIEASTDTRFKKDAIDNTLINVVQLRRVERNLDILEQTLADMKERGVAHREEWHYKDPETGKLTVAPANAPTPQGFKSLPDVPQLKGWVFDHNDGQVQELKDWLPRHDENWITKLDRLNNFMLRSNFLFPFVHPKNIAEFWTVARGADWLNPAGYPRLGRTLSRAVQEVMTMGPRYKEYLREGSALMSADARTQDFNQMLVNKAGAELIGDKGSFAALKKAFGPIVGTPAKLYLAFQEASHKLMWSFGDVMMMQRVLELQEKGMPIRDAIRKTEEVIPNYRVPAQIMDSPTGGRFLHHLFSNNRIFAIGRYHYNRLAAWGRMFKKVAKGTPEERKEALGQFLVMAVMGAAVIPKVFDALVQAATGNQNARVKRGGILAIPDAAARAASGQEPVAQAIAQVIDLSPEAQLGSEAISNRDYFGRDILSRYRSPAGNIAGAAELPLDRFGPLEQTSEALNPQYGPERMAGNIFGLDLPQKPPGQVKGTTAKMLRGKYRKQDQQDPAVKGLEALGVPQ